LAQIARSVGLAALVQSKLAADAKLAHAIASVRLCAREGRFSLDGSFQGCVFSGTVRLQMHDARRSVALSVSREDEGD
jgi:hypothetical protein